MSVNSLKHNKKNSRSPYEDVSTFHCPRCDGYRFNIFRDSISPDQKKRDIAACLDCHTFTYVYKLKNRYHDDIGKDFEICSKEKRIIISACQKCTREYEHDRVYQVTYYYGMDYPYADPEEEMELIQKLKNEDWKCPEHPDNTVLFFEPIGEIEWSERRKNTKQVRIPDKRENK